MSTPPGEDRPTVVLPQAKVEQPAVTTAPATRRAWVWPRRLPARIGRARTSTVVIGVLFVLLGGMNYVLPQDPYVTVPTEYGDVRVRSSQLTATPTPTPPPAESVPATTGEPTTPPSTSAPTGTTTRPAPTAGTTTPTPTAATTRPTPTVGATRTAAPTPTPTATATDGGERATTAAPTTPARSTPAVPTSSAPSS